MAEWDLAKFLQLLYTFDHAKAMPLFDKLAKEAEGKCPISNTLRPTMAIEVVTSVK